MWSDHILAELARNLDSDLGMAPDRIDHLFNAMGDAFPRASSTGYDGLIDSLRYTVQDPDDAHVVAAAKQERCDIIVTENIRDFNRAALVEHRMNLATSDEFMTELFEGKETKAIVYGGLLDMWARLRERPTVPQFLERLWGRDRLYGFIQGLTADVTQNVGVSRDRIDQRALQTRIRQIEQGIGI